MPEELPLKLNNNEIIVTVNRRLANYLRARYESEQITEGRLAWFTPTIIPLSTWLATIWQPSTLLLSANAEQFLWQQILMQACEEYPLLDYQACAQHAQQAAALLQQWQIDPEILATTANPDVLAFYQWWQVYQQRLQSERWESQSALPQRKPSKLPERIYLAGFDTLAPKIQAFLQSLDCIVRELPQTEFKATCYQVKAPDHAHELTWIAKWAHQQWLSDPKLKIACLVPDLLTERNAVERAFKVAFSDNFEVAVNIAGGVALSTYPLIQTAVQWLNFLLHPQLTTSLLLSPFWAGGQSELLQRAKFDQEYCPILSRVVTALKQVSIDDHLHPSDWAKVWQHILALTQWPGEQVLNSEEFQLVQSFQQQLREYASLDWLLGKQNYSEALAHFKILLTNTLFQIESRNDEPIQVLGILEAAGMQFDKIWITSLSDDRWPQQPAPNPFLPMELQRELDMPRASSQHELHYAQMILERIAKSCPILIASYPEAEGDRELSPSPLITHYQTLDLNFSEESPVARTELQVIEDSTAPPLCDDEKIRGGTRILQLQAKCPFRAFAEIRLRAEEFPTNSLGYDAAQRGSLVHAVLAKLWQQIESSEKLLALNEASQDQLIKETVKQVIQEENATTEPFFAELNRIDEQRLNILMHQWLALEKQRAAFTVKAVEHPVEMTLAGLPMRMRVDRIDILSDGTELIIDYKTGSPSPTSWFGARPDEPQLPLYALHNHAVTQGIVFAQLKPSLQKFHGVTHSANQLPGVKSVTNWQEHLNEWQKNLTQLAIDFCQGDARVDPKQYPATCNECALMSFCRINEQQESLD